MLKRLSSAAFRRTNSGREEKTDVTAPAPAPAAAARVWRAAKDPKTGRTRVLRRYFLSEHPNPLLARRGV